MSRKQKPKDKDYTPDRDRGKDDIPKGGKPDNPKDGYKNGSRYRASSRYERKTDGHANDVSAYKYLSELVEGSSKVTFKLAAGYPLKTQMGQGAETDTFLNYAVPQIMAIDFVPTVGMMQNENSGANSGARQIFQFIASKLNKEIVNYAPSDLLIYLQCVDSIYCLISEITRMFGVVGIYNSENLIYPRQLLKAMMQAGDDEIDDFIDNIANYRTRFNNIITGIASRIFIPQDYQSYGLHTKMLNDYYKDGSSQKSQLYFFRTSGVYMWDDHTSDQGTAARWIDKETFNGGLSNWLDMLSDLSSAIMNSTSFGYIWANMAQAYSDHSAMGFGLVPVDYARTPVEEDSWRLQIHNMDIVPLDCFKRISWGSSTSRDLSLTQSVNKNSVIWDPELVEDVNKDGTGAIDPKLSAALAILDGAKLFNDYVVAVDGDDFIEMSRMSVRVVGNLGSRHLESYGINIPTGLTIYQYNAETGELFEGAINSLYWAVDPYGTSLDAVRESVGLLTAMAMFDWHPIMYLTTRMLGTGDTTSVYPFAELSNYALVPSDTLFTLQTNIATSLWATPLMKIPMISK
nr:putative capsid [Marmot picobirnavirus]